MKNIDKAIYWYDLAAELGNKSARKVLDKLNLK